MASLSKMRRNQAPTVPSNYSERRIIDLENFMLHTHLRGEAALHEFNRQEDDRAKKPPPPFIKPDPFGLGLSRFFARIDDEITKMRGSPDYWRYREPRKEGR